MTASTGEEILDITAPVLAMLEAGELSREFSRAGIRMRHPEYSVDEVESALHGLLLGDALFREVWPNRPLPAP